MTHHCSIAGTRRHPPRSLLSHKARVAVLRRLNGEGVPFTLFSDFWDYDAIAKEVATSWALLAIVDAYYMSSTSKMIEADCARDRLPILVMPVEGDAALRFVSLLGPAAVTVLSGDSEEAGRQVTDIYHRAG